MGRTLSAAFLLLLLTLSASATDYAVMLNDTERAVLIELIDAAVKARGLDVAPNAVYLANKIKSAGVVTDQKQVPEEPTK